MNLSDLQYMDVFKYFANRMKHEIRIFQGIEQIAITKK